MAAPTELVERLTAYVKAGASSVSAADSAFILSSLEAAIALVDNRCGASKENVPMEVLYQSYVEVGAELYNRRAAPNGISQFTASDGAAIRVARDPMVAAEPILRAFLGGGIA